MLELFDMTAWDVIREWIEVRHSRAAAPGLDPSKERVQRSPTTDPDVWFGWLCRITCDIRDEATVDALNLLILGHDGSAWDPASGPEGGFYAVPLTEQAVGRRLKMGKLEVRARKRRAIESVEIRQVQWGVRAEVEGG
jgi:hypothetical protein